MRLKGFLIGACGLLLTGCFQHQPNTAELIDILEKVNSESEREKNLCIVNSYDLSVNQKQCQEGVRIAFLPKSFGNEQIPVIFAAVHCDHTRSIAMTNGAVSCIFSPAAEPSQ